MTLEPGTRYVASAGDLIMRIMCYPSGRLEIQAWETNSREIFATEVTRREAEQQLAMWDVLGVRVVQPDEEVEDVL